MLDSNHRASTAEQINALVDAALIAEREATPPPTHLGASRLDMPVIAALNVRARQSFTGCRVVITQVIQTKDDVPAVLDQVRWYEAFTPDNDPYGEHDFGSFRHAGETVFWKWDYYDVDLQMHSSDPSDPTITTRVLTIMLADEY